MRGIATFNHVENVENQYTGELEEQNVPVFTKHYAKVKTTLYQKFSAAGTDLEHALIIAVKHDKRLNLSSYDYYTVSINDLTYKITDISLDDTNYLSYDFITLQRIQGNRGK